MAIFVQTFDINFNVIPELNEFNEQTAVYELVVSVPEKTPTGITYNGITMIDGRYVIGATIKVKIKSFFDYRIDRIELSNVELSNQIVADKNGDVYNEHFSIRYDTPLIEDPDDYYSPYFKQKAIFNILNINLVCKLRYILNAKQRFFFRF